MGNEGSSELRLAAMTVWRYWCSDGRAGAAREAMEAVEAEQRRRIESFRTELQKIIGEGLNIKIKINGGCVEAEIEDLCFVAVELPPSYKQEHLTLVALLGRCSSCGVETMSEPFYNFAGLGKMLERFEPGHQHLCCARR
jgi:hypothetical protein